MGSRRTFTWLLGLAVLIGIVLRLYGLTAQVLIDDEWHGLNFVLGKTYGEVLTSFNPNDNSSPLLNVYALWLLGNVGWSETWLRAPSILAGLASVVLLPLSIRRTAGDRVAVIFALMLAVSPVLIFYSRFARAYAPLALSGFLAIASLARWVESGRSRYAIRFVAAAVTSIALHPSGVIVVFVPLGLAIGWKRFGPGPHTGRTEVRSMTAVAVSLLGFTAVALTPVMRLSDQLPWRASALSWDSVAGAAAMASGTANPFAAILVVAAAALGLATMWRSQNPIGWLAAGAAAAYAIVLAATRPKGVDHAIVVLRYAIPMVPCGLLLAAVGIDRVLERLAPMAGSRTGPVLTSAAVTAGLAGLFLAGPLPETYAMPNNFTNHSTFQSGYGRHAWEQSDARHIYPDPGMTAASVPAFYRTLAQEPGTAAIVEYPYDICNHNNLFYYFQHIHGRPVIAGYTTDRRLAGRRARGDALHEPFQISMLSADDILMRGPNPGQLAFRNMVEVSDPGGLVRSGAEYLVLHKDLNALAVLRGGYSRVPVDYASTPILETTYRQLWGDPVNEDSHLVVYRIPGGRP